ncbi:MAG: hypothetical protein WA989_08645, partial [Henriciella sp.]|uniref:hypothetical protein n=1 Tax=Henriciella sp. TaxID=1968823 RepID=UPI003C7544BB
MSELPFTRNRTSAERDAAIRAAVRSVTQLPSTAHHSRMAQPGDASALLTLLEHPDVRNWIYSLPKPLTLASVEAFIEKTLAAQARGEGLLSLNFDERGAVAGYSEVRVWPEWAAGEVAGAMRPDLQSKGQGGAGMARTFTWM